MRKGFTLIEVLICVVIVGIIALGVVPNIMDACKGTQRSSSPDTVYLTGGFLHIEKDGLKQMVNLTTVTKIRSSGSGTDICYNEVWNGRTSEQTIYVNTPFDDVEKIVSSTATTEKD